MSRARPELVAALALVAFAAAWALLHHGWYARDEITDIPVYERYGARIEDGDVPYRDFRVEYPPLALPTFAVPSLLTHSSDGYRTAFETLMAACGMAFLLLAGWTLAGLGAPNRRIGAALGFAALAPLLLGSVVLTRFDLWPAALAVGALAALVNGRDRLGSVTLGLGIAAKLWPAVLLPLLAAWCWRRGGRRAAAACVALAVAVVVLAYLPFLLLDPAAVLSSIGRQLGRPLQIESLGAGVLLALHHAAGMPLGWSSSYGSQNLTGVPAAIAAVVLSLAQVAALAWIWWRFARGPAEPERLLRYGAAAVVAFVALGKVLSPQFLVWLIPLVPLVRGRRGLAASALLGLACLLTQLWFPARYWDLVFDFDGLASWLVLLRDLALVALLAVLALPASHATR